MIAQRNQGMSLLELLVVLVIVSLVSTAIVQGLGFGLALYQRVIGAEAERAKQLRAEEWFRIVNGSLVAQTTPGESLEGTTRQFTAHTMNSLIGDDSVVRPIEWDIRRGVLRYKEADGEYLPVLIVGNDAEFEYLEESGRWRQTWPITNDSLDLPRAIRVSTSNRRITAAVRARRTPNLMLEESRRDRG